MLGSAIHEKHMAKNKINSILANFSRNSRHLPDYFFRYIFQRGSRDPLSDS